MTDKPLWLLDVDGVLNVATTRNKKIPTSAGWGDDWLSGVADHYGPPFPMLAAVPVLDFLRSVHDDGRAEIQWLTTWELEDGVRTIEKLFGLPEFPIAGRASDHPVDHWWKLPVVQRVHGRDVHRRIVWTDDDIKFSTLAKEWLSVWGDTVTAISPNPGMGLIPAHVENIRRVLDGDV